MRRSEINAILQSAAEFIQQCGFHLPPFAFWTPDDWHTRRAAVGEILDAKLGWDITDFGGGNFSHCGLLLFTLRNGTPASLKTQTGKLYAEKIMIVQPGQITPMHFHWQKMEDIINRSGGRLVIQLFESTPTEELDLARQVRVSVDGMLRQVPPGGTVSLLPGESISLPAGLYHTFWGEMGPVLVGEVSLVNDDEHDNRFLEPVGRFPVIEEDEPPLYLLIGDYPRQVRTG